MERESGEVCLPASVFDVTFTSFGFNYGFPADVVCGTIAK